MREQLLSRLPWFVSAVSKLPGIRRIALLGSITTDKRDPKDIDFLVVVDDNLVRIVQIIATIVLVFHGELIVGSDEILKAELEQAVAECERLGDIGEARIDYFSS